MQRLRGLKALIHDAVDHTTELVQEGHESSSRSVMRVLGAIPSLAPSAERVDGLRRRTTSGVLGTIRGVNRAIEAISDVGIDVAEAALSVGKADTDLALPQPLPMRSDVTGTARWLGDAALGLVNGVIGDALHAKHNGLALGMTMRYGDRYLRLDALSMRAALPEASSRVVIFVHGLATTEWSWTLESEAYHGDPAASFGTLLARDLGCTSIFVRYNSGRHVSENGRLLARELQRLVDSYPRAIEEIVLVGHSMGGLVIRSACHYADSEGLSWVADLRRVFCLGTPHRGAPLERVGQVVAAALGAVDTPATQICGRLLRSRSAGIKDLRWGALCDEDWFGRDPDAESEAGVREIPLLDRVTYHFVSATVTEDPEHPLGRLVGDLLVRVPSAQGPVFETRVFPIDTRHFGGVMHHQLQNHPAIYEQLRAACEAPS